MVSFHKWIQVKKYKKINLLVSQHAGNTWSPGFKFMTRPLITLIDETHTPWSSKLWIIYIFKIRWPATECARAYMDLLNGFIFLILTQIESIKYLLRNWNVSKRIDEKVPSRQPNILEAWVAKPYLYNVRLSIGNFPTQ